MLDAVEHAAIGCLVKDHGANPCFVAATEQVHSVVNIKHGNAAFLCISSGPAPQRYGDAETRRSFACSDHVRRGRWYRLRRLKPYQSCRFGSPGRGEPQSALERQGLSRYRIRGGLADRSPFPSPRPSTYCVNTSSSGLRSRSMVALRHTRRRKPLRNSKDQKLGIMDIGVGLT